MPKRLCVSRRSQQLLLKRVKMAAHPAGYLKASESYEGSLPALSRPSKTRRWREIQSTGEWEPLAWLTLRLDLSPDWLILVLRDSIHRWLTKATERLRPSTDHELIITFSLGT